MKTKIKKKSALESIERYVDFALKEDGFLESYENEHLLNFYKSLG